MRSIAILLVILVFGLPLGRKVGWIFSNAILYPLPTVFSAVFCVAWGCGVAYLTHRFIEWEHPRLILAVMIYGAGGYVAIPNYGLFREASIPVEFHARHRTIQLLPLLSYILGSILFAFVIRI